MKRMKRMGALLHAVVVAAVGVGVEVGVESVGRRVRIRVSLSTCTEERHTRT